MVPVNLKVKLLKGHELFDNNAYKKCVDEYKKKYSDISYAKIAELSQHYLDKEIDPRMVERLYKGELQQLNTERIDALQYVFESLTSIPANSLVFRKHPKPHFSKPSPSSLLNDIQTRNLIALHLNSAAHYMFLASENLINSQTIQDKSSFHGIVKAFLSESRVLCEVFESQKLGNIYDFLKNNFDDKIDFYIDEAFNKIIYSEKDPVIKKEQMISFIRNKQNEFQRVVDKALNDNSH